LWFGTPLGVSEFDGSTWTTYTTADGLAYNWVYAIAVDGVDHLWFGTHNGGVSEYDGSTWTTYTTYNSGLPDNRVLAIAVDGAGHLWFGTLGGGVSEFDGSAWTTYTTADGLAGNHVFAIAVDGTDHLWFGTYGGVSEFIPDDTIPPAAITDLAASIGGKPGEIDLARTAPGDNGNTGTATTYIVRYRDTSIVSEFGWSLATDVSGEPTPQAAGSSESMTISGLTPGQTYYFAIKTQDEVPNTSGLSNSPSAMAREEPLWALMFYMDGDNNLDNNHVAAFNQLESAADNSNANIIVVWDRSANNGDSAYYEVQHDVDLAETSPAAVYPLSP